MNLSNKGIRKVSSSLAKFLHCYLVLFLLISITSCAQDDQVEKANPYKYSPAPFDLTGVNAKFIQDIAYDTFSETTLDIFLPKSETRTGLVIYYHGGGFAAGDKSDYYKLSDRQLEFTTLLVNGIAVATVNYRLIKNKKDGGILKSLNDSKRALQFIRSRSTELNIRQTDIVLTGRSAGAGTSLWIATNNEMSDLNNPDPVLQQSTRVKAIALEETQSSYDLRSKWINDIFFEFGITWEQFILDYGGFIKRIYGINDESDYDKPSTKEYREKVDMISHLSSDDPEFWVENINQASSSPNDEAALLHHPFFVRELIEKANLVNVKHVAYYRQYLIKCVNEI